MINADCYCIRNLMDQDLFTIEKDDAVKDNRVDVRSVDSDYPEALMRNLSKDFIKKTKAFNWYEYRKSDNIDAVQFELLSSKRLSKMIKKFDFASSKYLSSFYDCLDKIKSDPYYKDSWSFYKKYLNHKRKVDGGIIHVAEKKIAQSHLDDAVVDEKRETKENAPVEHQKLKKVVLFDSLCDKAKEGFNNYVALKKFLKQDVRKFTFEIVEPLVSILMNFDEIFDSLKFIFSDESSEVKFAKKQTTFSFEYFYDTKDCVIMSALKDGKYRAREFRKDEFTTIRDYVDVL